MHLLQCLRECLHPARLRRAARHAPCRRDLGRLPCAARRHLHDLSRRLPEEAIRFQPRAGGPFLPVLDAGRCTGCGACVAPCPSAAIAAQPRMTTPETITETAHA